MTSSIKVPLFYPWITNADKKAMLDCMNSPILSGGPKLKEFELKFAKYTGSKYAIGVSNATAALHISLLTLGIGKNDEVIVPDITFAASANSVALTGAKPVCADVDETLNISIKSIEQKITKKTKAILPVHFAGFPAPMDKIKKIATKNNLSIIEDCAHAVGSFYQKKHVGTFGDTGCFSFFATKNLTTVEGGMITTNSKTIADTASKLRSHGIDKTLDQRYQNQSPWIYDILIPGFNYKIDEPRCALGISQLKRINTITKKRRNAASYYTSKLNNIPGIEVVNSKNTKGHVYHLFIIRVKEIFPLERNQLHKKLQENDIQSTLHYYPIHNFNYIKKQKISEKDFPNSNSAAKECLTIPLYPTITKKQQDHVISTITKLSKGD